MHSLTVSLLLIIGYVQCVPLEYLYSKCDYLDLTYEFNQATIYWPTMDPYKRDTVFKGEENGVYYEAYKFCAAEHGGTHLDAPSHFNKHGLTAEKIPLKSFVGEAFVVNISQKAHQNRDYVLTVADLEDFESKHGRIEDDAILIVHTGWGSYWPNKKEYLGSDVPKDDQNLHFPGVSGEAAKWLVSNRNISVLGIDTASMDAGDSKDYITHQVLLGKNISGFENLRNVDKLPARGATIIALPMSITDGSGAPLRAFAVGWNGPKDPCRKNKNKAGSKEDND